MEAEAEYDPRINGCLLFFLHCPLQSSRLSIPSWNSKTLWLAALLWFGMLVGKRQEWELLPASVPSYCQIREPILCALGRKEEYGKKGRNPVGLGAAEWGSESWREGVWLVWENHNTTVFWYSAFRIGLCVSWAVAVIAVLDACFSAGGAKVVPGNSTVCKGGNWGLTTRKRTHFCPLPQLCIIQPLWLH